MHVVVCGSLPQSCTRTPPSPRPFLPFFFPRPYSFLLPPSSFLLLLKPKSGEISCLKKSVQFCNIGYGLNPAHQSRIADDTKCDKCISDKYQVRACTAVRREGVNTTLYNNTPFIPVYSGCMVSYGVLCKDFQSFVLTCCVYSRPPFASFPSLPPPPPPFFPLLQPRTRWALTSVHARHYPHRSVSKVLGSLVQQTLTKGECMTREGGIPTNAACKSCVYGMVCEVFFEP